MSLQGKKKVVVIGKLHFPEPLGLNITRFDIYNQKPKTWLRKFNSIKQQVERGEVHGIIVYLATPLFLQASKDGYYEAWSILFETMKKTKSLIIAYEENMYENFESYDWYEKRYLNLEELQKRINEFEEGNLDPF